MPRPDPDVKRTPQGEGTKKRILKAAIREFAQHGFAGARMDRLARAAGVNSRLLFYYYGDKQSLYELVKEETLRLATESYNSASEYPDPIERLIAHVTIAGQKTSATYYSLMRWQASEWKNARHRQTDLATRFLNHNVRLFNEARDRGQLRKGMDPDMLALAFEALTLYPQLFPDNAARTTGLDPNSKDFHAAHKVLIEQLARYVLPGIVEKPESTIPEKIGSAEQRTQVDG